MRGMVVGEGGRSSGVLLYCINVTHSNSPVERRGSLMVSTSACHAAGRGFDSRTGNMILLG